MDKSFYAVITPVSQDNKVPRKVIQITDGSEVKPVLALCNDGSIWSYEKSTTIWSRIKDIPQEG